jgi:hypothetical protein
MEVRSQLLTYKQKVLSIYKLCLNYFKTNENEFMKDGFKITKMLYEQIIENNNKNNTDDNLESSFETDHSIIDELLMFKSRNYEYNNKENKIIFKSYPIDNMLLIFSNNLYLCLKEKKFIFEYKSMSGLKDFTLENVEKLGIFFSSEEVENFMNLFGELEQSELFDTFFSGFLDNFGDRGILTLLGMRQTQGSLNTHLPPDVSILVNNFSDLQTKNSPKSVSILTVGARALCKHSHRASDVYIAY